MSDEDKERYVVGAVKIPYEDRDIAHAVITPEDDRAFYDVINADDDPGVPLGAEVTYRVELTPEEAARFREADNCRYVVKDNRVKVAAVDAPFAETLAWMGASIDTVGDFHGRDVPVGILDGGTTAAVRSALGVTLLAKQVFGDSPVGPDEITVTHGCLVAPCLIPQGGRVYDAVVFGDDGYSFDSAVAAAAKWCADQGAKVVNFSGSGPEGTPVYRDMLQYLLDRGVQFYASAGNEASNKLGYPSAYSTEFINCHSSISFDRKTGKRSSFSNYAADASGCAPGTAERGMSPSGSLVLWNGTSSSAPHMARLNVMGMTGGRYSAAAIGAALKANTRETGQPRNEQGAGAYNLYNALKSLGAFYVEPTPDPTDPGPIIPDPVDPTPTPHPGVQVPLEVSRTLRGLRGRRTWRFRYELLNVRNERVRDLENVVGGEVDHDFFAEIKRTAKFTIHDDGSINFLTQRIRPYAGIKMPDGEFHEWSLGVFLLTTPSRVIDISGVVTRDVDAYDQTIVLQDDTVPDRYFVNANYRYTDAIQELLRSTQGVTSFSIEENSALTPAALEWEPGTSKYRIISDMLTAINYGSLWFDGDGIARAAPYVPPSERDADFEYRTNETSVILPDAEQNLDLYAIPNRWVLIVSNSDQPPLRAEVTNEDVTSPTSTMNRGRVITRVITDVDAPNQAMLNAIAERYRDEQGQVYETIAFKTGLMPFHDNANIIDFEYDGFVGYGRFMETKWSMNLIQGAEMTHEARRAVSILGGYGTGPYGTMPYGG